MKTLRHLAIALAILAVSLLAFACSDDNDAGDADEPTSTPIEVPAQEEPTEPEGEPADDDPTSEPAASAFDSYHYVVALELTFPASQTSEGGVLGGTVEGDYVAPDSHAFTSRFELAGISGSEDIVIIGDDAWYREGAGEWQKVTRADALVQDSLGLSSADEGFLDDPDFEDDLQALDSTPEEINGLQTRRYEIPRETVEALSGILGSQFDENLAGIEAFDMTVWLDDDSGGLVRAEFDAEVSSDFLGGGSPFDVAEGATITMTMRIDRTRIDDASIEIEPPA